MVIVLDTNAYTALIANDASMATAIQKCDKVILPVIVIAELFSGFKVGNKEEYNMQIFEQFLQISKIEIAPIDYDSAMIYADIYKQLKHDGKPIPVNDIWIAAITIQQKAAVLTLDKHFSYVKGLKIYTV